MKLSFLSLCISTFILLASCTKEDTPWTNGGNPNSYIAPISVTASEWTSASAVSWSDATVSAKEYFRMEWSAPELTESMVNNGAVLAYAKTSNNAPELIPAMFEPTYNAEWSLYGIIAQPQTIHVFQSKIDGGPNTTPTINGNVSFHYILIDNMSTANGGIIDYNGVHYSIEDLKGMSYADVTAILGIAAY